MVFLDINISQLTLITLIFFVGGTVKGIIGIRHSKHSLHIQSHSIFLIERT